MELSKLHNSYQMSSFFDNNNDSSELEEENNRDDTSWHGKFLCLLRNLIPIQALIFATLFLICR